MREVGAILLAAGCSRRFGAANKLVVPLDEQPIVRRVGEVLMASGASRDVVVVTGHEKDSIEAALTGLPVRFVHNESWPAGMGSSIARGIRALKPETSGAFIVPGDLPFLTATLLNGLISSYRDAEGDRIVVPTTAGGGQRNPVLWPHRFFSDLASLDGPKGGKALLKRHWAEVIRVPVADASVTTDVDTPEDLINIRRIEGRRPPLPGEEFEKLTARQKRDLANRQPAARKMS